MKITVKCWLFSKENEEYVANCLHLFLTEESSESKEKNANSTYKLMKEQRPLKIPSALTRFDNSSAEMYLQKCEPGHRAMTQDGASLGVKIFQLKKIPVEILLKSPRRTIDHVVVPLIYQPCLHMFTNLCKS